MRSSNYNNAHSSKGEGLPHNVKLANEFGAFEKERGLLAGAQTLGQTAKWFKSALAVERTRGNLRLSGYSACGQDGGVQLPRAYVEVKKLKLIALLKQTQPMKWAKRIQVVCEFAWELDELEEERKWFMEAMQAQIIDVVKRMKEITLVMQTPDNVLEEDVGRASRTYHHTIHGLPPLLKFLSTLMLTYEPRMLERITKKRTKNEAKSTKPDSEWKSKEKSKSKSKPKSTEVNPSQPRSQKVNKSRNISLRVKIAKP
ncbi:hypothetical protein Tco_1351579 [Tanacetum coccineum]